MVTESIYQADNLDNLKTQEKELGRPLRTKDETRSTQATRTMISLLKGGSRQGDTCKEIANRGSRGNVKSAQLPKAL